MHASESMATPVEIPKRAFFKSAEVCAIAGVQPYVLKSWEAEFPALGGKKRKDGSHVYGRAELELVLEIKDLVYGDGLTLGAARRRLHEAVEPTETEEELSFPEPVDDDTREQLATIKKGLREILDLLVGDGADVAQAQLELDSAQAPNAGAKGTQASGARTAKGRPAAKRKRQTA